MGKNYKPLISAQDALRLGGESASLLEEQLDLLQEGKPINLDFVRLTLRELRDLELDKKIKPGAYNFYYQFFGDDLVA